ncbi:hypothetical protein CPR19092_LGOLGGFK_00136 [Companilactobacillus paralimentarius]|jgi:hypothetical protein
MPSSAEIGNALERYGHDLKLIILHFEQNNGFPKSALL